MKKIFVVAAALSALLAINSNAIFEKVNTYTEGQFSDVDSSSWYSAEVRNAYQLGLMNGVSEKSYSPDASVTVAQGITLAARVNAIYNGKEITQQGDEWYSAYVEYAKENGIVTKGQFEDYNRNITRKEMAGIFVKSLPEECFKAKNNVTSIPDVAQYKDYFKDVLMLYNAGVLSGSDDYGTFYPNNDIKRSEAAAIINRVALAENRKSFELKGYPSAVFPLYFADDNGTMTRTEFGTYGWEYDARGADRNFTKAALSVLDIRDDAKSTLFRKFDSVKEGALTLETVLETANANNGFHIKLSDGLYGKSALDLFTKDGTWYIVQNGKQVSTDVGVKNQTLGVRIVCDLSENKNTIYFDGKMCGEYALSEFCNNGVNHIVFESEKESVCAVTPTKTKLYTGYYVNETFVSVKTGDTIPETLEVTGAKGSIVNHGGSSYDLYGLRVDVTKNQKASVTTRFLPVGAKFVSQIKLFMKDDMNASFKVSNNELSVGICAKDGVFYTLDGKTLYDYDNNVWQTLRIEINTFTGEVVYRIDGRIMGKASTDGRIFDTLSLEMLSDKDTFILADDFYVYNLFDDEDDYVPEPVVSDSAGYNVGIEVCDIWRNGFQFGWDYTSAFEETLPYLGMFDEGSQEVADWENKWLSEHGVDFKLVCWYSGAQSFPISMPRNSFGLTAYQNSKYSNAVKYALMWENSSNLPRNSADFRSFLVPYWIEYYFKDKDRYFTIDNKALFTIYRTSTLTEIFGSNSNVKLELDYLRECVKALGYDDLIILVTGSTNVSSKDIETMKEMGFDGVYSYNLGTLADSSDYQLTQLAKQKNTASNCQFTAVPTVAVGFNDMYLYDGKRYSNITPEDYKKVFDGVKSSILSDVEAGEWNKNLVILSNWNEFGEGHYIMPAQLCGFDYLDVIRQAFVGDGAHSDVIPSQKQKARFNSLYNQNMSRLRRLRLENENEGLDVSSFTVAKEWSMKDAISAGEWKSGFGFSNLELRDDALCGSSAGGDFALQNNKVSIPADNAQYVHINMKLSGCSAIRQTAQLYFVTSADTAWAENKNRDFEVTADGEFHDYYVNMSDVATWSGEIKGIRLDPINHGECDFEIASISLCKAPDSIHVFLGDTSDELTVDFAPTVNSGANTVVSVNPYNGFFDKCGIFYRWDKASNELSLKSIHGEITLVMQSSTAEANGKTVNFVTPPSLRDGIPQFELEKVMTALGFKVEKNGNNIIITDPSQDVGNKENKYCYEFNVAGYSEGWNTISLGSAKVADGYLCGTSKSNGQRHDPLINSPTNLAIDASVYKKVVVGLKYNIEDGSTSAKSTIFFRSASTQFSENSCVSVTTPKASSDTVELVFDMSKNANWNEMIYQIRFDPFEAQGSFEIDYIRVVQ